MSIARLVLRTVLTIMAVVLVYQFFWGRSPLGITRGALAPPFALPQLTGGTADLTAYRGKVVWLTFWTTWCGACHQMLPSVDTLHQLFGQRAVVLGINVEEDANTVAAYMQQNKLSFPVLRDVDGTIARLYGIRGFPASILIDQQGHVVQAYLGVDNYAGQRYLDTIHSVLARE